MHSGVSSSTERAPDDDGGSCRLVAYRNLLVPIDFSEHSKKTIEYKSEHILTGIVGWMLDAAHGILGQPSPTRSVLVHTGSWARREVFMAFHFGRTFGINQGLNWHAICSATTSSWAQLMRIQSMPPATRSRIEA